MKHMLIYLLAGFLFTGFAAQAQETDLQITQLIPLEERIYAGMSSYGVSITATFEGKEIFVYGAIERNRFLEDIEDVPDIIIAIRGPASPIWVRKKAKIGGIWVNNDAVRIAAAPSFYAVSSTRPLKEILRLQDDNTHRIGLDKAVFIAGSPTSAQDPEEFRQAVIRLRKNEGLYREIPYTVLMNGNTLYESRITLPANITDGDYEARIFLVRDKRVIDIFSSVIQVRKTGLERLVYRTAQDHPLLYGILSVLFALFAGWSASEVFRRLRR